MKGVGGESMGWKRVLALALVVLFLGMTVSSASATASFVNTTTNSTVTVPQELAKKGPGDDVKPKFLPAIGVGISIVVGSTELLALTVSLATLAAIGLYKVIEKYGGRVADVILRATGFKQLSDFGDGFFSVAGSSLEHPKVEVHLKKLWFIPLPIAEKIVIKDGSRTVVEVKKSELDQINDLFTPKEFGRLLGQAYLNGWDANDAKKLAEEFDRKYKNFRVKFRGRYACGSYFSEGDVIIDDEGATHIIERHIKRRVYDHKSKFEQITAKQLLQMLEETIESGRINCDRSNAPHEVVLEKYYYGLGAKNKLRVVIRKMSNGLYRIVTAHPVDWD
ncbi:hypothetical protein [Thermococcus thermotolerans]|uniref:hypothetical protein n=1 Tax=Thermococcus thermotolerans TaxID=2969672 RepID=UPI0021577355|nr:hypothetical protein [Thermococcus thermotolerans]